MRGALRKLQRKECKVCMVRSVTVSDDIWEWKILPLSLVHCPMALLSVTGIIMNVISCKSWMLAVFHQGSGDIPLGV